MEHTYFNRLPNEINEKIWLCWWINEWRIKMVPVLAEIRASVERCTIKSNIKYSDVSLANPTTPQGRHTSSFHKIIPVNILVNTDRNGIRESSYRRGIFKEPFTFIGVNIEKKDENTKKFITSASKIKRYKDYLRGYYPPRSIGVDFDTYREYAASIRKNTTDGDDYDEKLAYINECVSRNFRARAQHIRFMIEHQEHANQEHKNDLVLDRVGPSSPLSPVRPKWRRENRLLMENTAITKKFTGDTDFVSYISVIVGGVTHFGSEKIRRKYWNRNAMMGYNPRSDGTGGIHMVFWNV